MDAGKTPVAASLRMSLHAAQAQVDTYTKQIHAATGRRDQWQKYVERLRDLMTKEAENRAA